MNKKIILASKSPRRIELLKKAGFDVVVIPADIDEYVDPELSPNEVVKTLALQKARAVRDMLLSSTTPENDNPCSTSPSCSESNMPAPILAADTIVYLNQIIGKPTDRNDAEKILMKLSGKVHQVYTGVAIIYPKTDNKIEGCNSGCTGCKMRCANNPRNKAGHALIFSERTNVFFKSYTKEEIQDYLDTDEPYDKAGAYAIQGYFGQFIDHIDGSFSNVMGLPVERLLDVFQLNN